MTSLHHVALSTAQMEESSRCYDAVLGELGYKHVRTSERLCTWIGDGPEILLYIAEGDDRTPHTLGRPGWHHAALHVDSDDEVYAVHRAVSDGGWTVVHAPREYPEYAPGYFAVFVEDPDGIRIEVAP